MTVINILGAPGVGKSTVAAGIFYELKRRNAFRVELVTEFAKAKVWEESFKTLDDQLYIFAKQQHAMVRLLNKVDVVITDSPLIFSAVYGRLYNYPHKALETLILEVFNSYSNFNVLLERPKGVEYEEIGRYQSSEESIKVGKDIQLCLDYYRIKYHKLTDEEWLSSNIVGIIIEKFLKEYKPKEPVDPSKFGTFDLGRQLTDYEMENFDEFMKPK